MEEITLTAMPHFGIVLRTIIVGLVIAGLYLVVKKIFVPVVPNGRAQKKLVSRLTYLEKLFWPVFILSLGISLILSHIIVGLALCVFVAGIFWKPLKNYFHGLIFTAEKNYDIGQRIRYKNRLGTITAFNNLTLEMELEDGESLDIPYSYFADTTIIRTSPQSGVMSHTMTIPVAKPCDLEQEKQRIKGLLIALPWVLPNQKIVFEHLSETPEQYLLKVTVHGIDKNHLYKVETNLRSMYLKVG